MSVFSWKANPDAFIWFSIPVRTVSKSARPAAHLSQAVQTCRIAGRR